MSEGKKSKGPIRKKNAAAKTAIKKKKMTSTKSKNEGLREMLDQQSSSIYEIQNNSIGKFNSATAVEMTQPTAPEESANDLAAFLQNL